MKKSFLSSCLLVMSMAIFAQTPTKNDLIVVDSVKMSSEEVLAWFDSLAVEYAEELDVQDISDNPLYFRLFMPLALYNSAIDDAIVPEQAAAAVTDAELLPVEKVDSVDDALIRHINQALVRMYMEHPELVEITEEELMSVKAPTAVTQDAAIGINKEVIATVDVNKETEIPELVQLKPKYWKVFGDFQGKYTQSYFSDNWYKGGDNNHSVLGQVTVQANYAKNHTTLDNKLEMKLGYVTTEEMKDGEKVKSLKTNQDQLRITSKYGLRAIENWYYSAQLQGNTQFMPVRDNNDNLKSKFFAPVYGSLSIGMDYKPKFKNKDLTLSVQLSPLSYDCRYVSEVDLATRYGIEKGKQFKYTIGSRVDANLTWKFLKDFKLTTKANYFTGFEHVEANVENTLDYQLSKYFSIQFFMHWRFDDSVKRDVDLGYSQLKEFLTLNFNYSW
ncbi:MAG: DUF3078 domain-containing protein [Bacteroidaceae bacterium]|nr:DUF3078 domain-containing protein [Bacteroidaceae bacterium]